MQCKMMDLLKIVVVVACISSVYGEYRGYPTNVTVSIECHELSVIATWNKTDFYGGEVTKIIWNDEKCDRLVNLDTQVTAATNFTDCGSVITQHNNTIAQENTARVYVTYQTQNVERVIIYSFIAECTLDRSIYTPVGAMYNITEKKVVAGNATEVTNFNVEMEVYNDNSFTGLLGNRIVSAFDPIYVGIHEKFDNQLLKFITHECYATQTNDRDGAKYVFFENKCPVDSTYKEIANEDSHRYHFQINAFRFIQIQQVTMNNAVYIHCRLNVCKNQSRSDECVQEATCGSRRKRRAIEEIPMNVIESAGEKPIEQITITSQQLSFLKATCEEMKCPQFSTCIDLQTPTCRCGQGYIMNTKSNECTKERSFRITGLHFAMEFDKKFLDPYSREYMKLANRIEKELSYFIGLLKDDTIEGIKVVNLREGSVIADVDLIYSKVSSKNLAYNVFLESISADHREKVNYANEMVLKTDMQPSMQKISVTSEAVLVVSIVIPLLAVLITVVAVVYVVKTRRFGFKENNAS